MLLELMVYTKSKTNRNISNTIVNLNINRMTITRLIKYCKNKKTIYQNLFDYIKFILPLSLRLALNIFSAQ